MEQAELLKYAIEVLECQDLTYMIVGSFASIAFGEPRLTHDIDIVILLAGEQVEKLCSAFPDPEFYVSLTAVRGAISARGQFNVIHPTSGNKIDFIVARNDAWGKSQLARAVRKPILAGCEANVAAPEDVILGKLLYYKEGGSDKHLRDIAGMLQVSGDEIDCGYVDNWAKSLGVEMPWRAVLDRLG